MTTIGSDKFSLECIYHPACFFGDADLCLLSGEEYPVSEKHQKLAHSALAAAHYLQSAEGCLYFFEPLLGGFSTYSPKELKELSEAREDEIVRTLQDNPFMLEIGIKTGKVRQFACDKDQIEAISSLIGFYKDLERQALEAEARAFEGDPKNALFP